MTGKMGIDLFVICTEMCSGLWKINPDAFDFSKSLPILFILVDLAFLKLCSVCKRVRIKLRRVKDLFLTSHPHKMKPRSLFVTTGGERSFASEISLISPHLKTYGN